METNTDVVFIFNSQPRIFHLPDTVRRHTGNLAGSEVATAVVALGDGKPITPSAPREKDGKPQPTAIDKGYWDSVKNNKQVQVWLRKGWLSVSDSMEGDIEIDGLDRYNAKTAIALVSGETNLRLLTEWSKSEGRADVKAAIASRLEELRQPVKGLAPLGNGNGRK